MRVVLQAPLLTGRVAGPGVHFRELTRAALEVEPSLELVSRDVTVRGRARGRASALHIDPRVRSVTTPVPATVLRVAQARLGLPRDRWLLGRYDIYHQFHTDADPGVPDARLIITLHDTVASVWPGDEGAFYRHAGRILRRAAAVLTGSAFSAGEIQAAFGVDPARVHVISNGVDHARFHPTSSSDTPTSPASSIDHPYIMYVGGHTPRKNVARVIEAVAVVRAATGVDVGLVLVGPVGAAESRLRASAPRGLPPERLTFAGYLSDEAVSAVYRAARLLLFPSLYEGFGLPVLEAAACGTPVVTSSGTALQEIAGPAAVLVDPLNVHAIADGVRTVLEESESEAAARRSIGQAWAARFTWQAAAERLVRVYASVGDGA